MSVSLFLCFLMRLNRNLTSIQDSLFSDWQGSYQWFLIDKGSYQWFLMYRFYNSLPPITKAYGTACLLVTIACQIGLLHPALIAHVPELTFWRFQVYDLLLATIFLMLLNSYTQIVSHSSIGSLFHCSFHVNFVFQLFMLKDITRIK